MPKIKITGMPKVKILALPKAAFGGQQCPPGEIWDEITQTCVFDNTYSYNQTTNTTTNNEPYVGQEYDPTQDYQKNQPALAVINSSGQKVGGVASDGKTGPGTGVNPAKSNECPNGWHKNKEGKCTPNKTGIEYANDITQGALTLSNAFATISENKKAKREAESSMRNKAAFSTVKPGGAMTFGKTQLNEGIEFPNMMTPPNDGQYMGNYFGRSMGQFGGTFPTKVNNGPTKIKIISEPDTEVMKYGGQSNYGFDSGWRRSYTEMNKASSDYYTDTMSEDKNTDEEPVLEAEGGETIYKPGDQSFFKLQGPKHTEGGIELTGSQVNSKNKEVPSFVYSDTKDLKIKDKNIQDHFGMTYKKAGITPAEISKKYDLNKFKAILQDVDTDDLAKSTAQLMIDKNEKRLAELAIVQEKMKGLKAPKFAEQTLQKGNAKFGGFIPSYAEGGFNVDVTTTKAPTEAGVFTPEQLKILDPSKKKVTTSERVNAGDTKVSIQQGATSGDVGTYGGITEKEVEELKKRHPWYFSKRPNWNPKNVDKDGNSIDVGDFQNEYNKEYAKKHGFVYFVPKGSKEDRKFNRFDSRLGEFTYNAPALDQDEPVEETTTTTTPPAVAPRYMCIADSKGVRTVQILPSGSIGGYKDATEAAKNCGKAPGKYPFDYLAPDKVNMLAHAAIFPKEIFPYNPDLAFNPRPLALEDWRAKAAQRFSTQYAAPSAQLATFGPTQGLGANLSFLAGQTGQQMAAEDIAPTISRNIDRVNAYNASEGQRQDTIDAFNNQNKVERWKGYATTKQNYDNAMRGYLKENSDAFTRAWKNRMHLGEINDTNPNFFMTPRSGRQTWKGNAFYTGTGATGGDNDNLGKMYNIYYKQFLDDMTDIPVEKRPEEARKLALEAIKADRYDETSDSYSNKSRKRSSGFDFN